MSTSLPNHQEEVAFPDQSSNKPQQEQHDSATDAVRSALRTAFSDASDFLIIGLTGRTGSGCTTCAELLSRSKLPLPDTDQSHYTGNERRKYRIIRRYIEKNWQDFYWLRLSTVLARYIFQLHYADFLRFVEASTTHSLDDVCSHFEDFKPEYGNTRESVLTHLSLPESNKNDIESKKRSAYKLYFDSLPKCTKALKDKLEELSLGTYTKLFQAAGDNVRSSGAANSSKFMPGNVFDFPKTINKIIRAS